MTEVKYVEYDGPCPFLFCMATGKHKHPVCPKCGALMYGNVFCDECKRNVDMEREITIIQLSKIRGDNASG
jgi:hypothetical protein